MHTTNLRKVGGSIMLVVPPALIEILDLQPGSQVGLTVRSGQLVVDPLPKPRYSLDELLRQCNPKAPRKEEERQWITGKAVGRELI